MKEIRIVGVPEHFNLPWHLCIENGEFSEVGIELTWQDVPEGTGKMCQLLREKKTDLAVILTEGIIKDIADGNDSTIVQQYVGSPLLWGIHVAEESNFRSVEDLKGKRIAISRFGSGSHLMAIVHAKQMNWDINQLDFVVINTLEGAIKALQNNEADYFMWERFMTQPIVDQKIFRRIGECPTPWPSFMIVANNDFLSNNKSAINYILDVINSTTSEFKLIPSIDRTLASKYNLEIEQIQDWLRKTQWSQRKLKSKDFNLVQDQLIELGLMTSKLTYEKTVL
ncbi:MAG: ABC transporter substrate-binding protein [Flavobacteriaceae bacterium]|jgi:ABC-type nitrate/sulfonate/bicarbonate transport system substrate-binding protein|nr:ABC transporter substrate-binding protein [Flavobacteriaceae bacterium]